MSGAHSEHPYGIENGLLAHCPRCETVTLNLLDGRNTHFVTGIPAPIFRTWTEAVPWAWGVLMGIPAKTILQHQGRYREYWTREEYDALAQHPGMQRPIHLDIDAPPGWDVYEYPPPGKEGAEDG